MVSGMTEPPSRYDVIVTVATDGGCGPDPSGFAVAAGRAASSRNASVMSAHTWDKIISVVTVEARTGPGRWRSPRPSDPRRSGLRPRHPAAE
jgi:hypothetical protein